MPINTCGILLPHYYGGSSIKDNDGCLKGSHNDDDHLIKSTNGKFILWKDDPLPCKEDTICDGVYEDCEAYSYDEISKERAIDIIKKSYNDSLPEDIMIIVES